ncbi:MAG: hypothetical protein AB8G05_17500 [Oligoflexales bacterium]
MLGNRLSWFRNQSVYIVLILLLYPPTVLLAQSNTYSNSSNTIKRHLKYNRTIGYLALSIITAKLPFSYAFNLNTKHLFSAPSHSKPRLRSEKFFKDPTLLNAKTGDSLDAFTPSGKFFYVFEVYLKDIELQTSLTIGDRQRTLILQALSSQTFYMVDYKTNRKFHRRFQRKKSKLIKKWEEETSLTWPRYYKDIYNDHGNIIRFKGQQYDAHHIIECIFAGPSEWWNIHPAHTQDEHQDGIHRLQGPAWWVYHDNCKTEDECQLFADPKYIEKAS